MVTVNMTMDDIGATNPAEEPLLTSGVVPSHHHGAGGGTLIICPVQ